VTRVKRGIETKRRHKKLLEQAKGFWMTRHKHIRSAKETLLHAGEYAFRGRKEKKRDFRGLWIVRIGEASKAAGISYSVFIKKLIDNKIEIDRKILSWLVTNQPQVFAKIIEKVK
jgi:large subunit ribosomal protein L20